ncbi:hypothetical protein FOBRF1_012996 [Fusarium oxysporum]
MKLTLLFPTAISMATFAIDEAAAGRNAGKEFYGLGNCEDDCFFKERNGGPNAQVTATWLGGESGLSTPNVPFTTAIPIWFTITMNEPRRDNYVIERSLVGIRR